MNYPIYRVKNKNKCNACNLRRWPGTTNATEHTYDVEPNSDFNETGQFN